MEVSAVLIVVTGQYQIRAPVTSNSSRRCENNTMPMYILNRSHFCMVLGFVQYFLAEGSVTLSQQQQSQVQKEYNAHVYFGRKSLLQGFGVSSSTFGQRFLSLCLGNSSRRCRKNTIHVYVLDGSHFCMVLGFREVLSDRGFCPLSQRDRNLCPKVLHETPPLYAQREYLITLQEKNLLATPQLFTYYKHVSVTHNSRAEEVKQHTWSSKGQAGVRWPSDVGSTPRRLQG